MRKKGGELQEKISRLDRLRKFALAGLIVGVALFILGQRIPFAEVGVALSITGYALLLACTVITSFLTVRKWLHSRSTEAVMEEKTELPLILCPRCGTPIEKGKKYCPKCGKMTRVKKR